MSTGGMKKRRARTFRLESLEDRSLLNAALPASPTAEVHALKTTVVTQTVQGTLKGAFSASKHAASLMGSGPLSVLGETEINGQYKSTVNLKTGKLTISGGTATLTFATGTLKVKYTGSGQYANDELTFTLKGTVTGGTGAFKGATGTFTASNGTAPELSSGKFSEFVTATVKTKVKS